MTPNPSAHPQLEMCARASLRPNPKNARTHSDKQISQIAAAIKRFGFLVPIVIDDDNLIAAGFGRWKAAASLGLDTVPVIRAKFLSDADRRAFALAENRIAQLSGWDSELLTAELNFLADDGYKLEITGFTTADLNLGIVETAAGATPDQVELPAADVKPVSRSGDLWLIGPHRLLCGNSLDAGSYERLLGDDRAAMVFSDPPYGVKIDGHVSGLGRVQHREFVMMSGEQTAAELITFLRAMFRHCVRFSTNGSIHYHCMDWRHIREMMDASDGVYSDFKQLIAWTKTNAGMGTFYRNQHELVFVFKSGKAKHINNFALGETGRYRTNVWSYAGANTFRKGRATDLADHPTVKRVALVADAILDCSNRGDIILDPFSGSGTTLAAAHKMKRIGAAIEIDPIFVDTALRRMTRMFDLEVCHADGRSFAEVAAARAGEDEHG